MLLLPPEARTAARPRRSATPSRPCRPKTGSRLRNSCEVWYSSPSRRARRNDRRRRPPASAGANMREPVLIVTAEGAAVTLRIHRPEAGNRLNLDLLKELLG